MEYLAEDNSKKTCTQCGRSAEIMWECSTCKAFYCETHLKIIPGKQERIGSHELRVSNDTSQCPKGHSTVKRRGLEISLDELLSDKIPKQSFRVCSLSSRFRSPESEWTKLPTCRELSGTVVERETFEEHCVNGGQKCPYFNNHKNRPWWNFWEKSTPQPKRTPKRKSKSPARKKKFVEKLSLSDKNIDNKKLAGLKNYTGVKELNLNGLPITNVGLTHIAELPDLEILDLSNTKITDRGLAHLSQLKKLRSLELHMAHITGEGLGHLQELPSLDYLGLTHVAFSVEGWNALRQLSALRRLRLAHIWVDFSELVRKEKTSLAGMKSLKQLVWISDHKSIERYALKWKHTPTAWILDCFERDFRFTDRVLNSLELDSLKNLRYLHLSEFDGITDDSISCLARLKTLSNLDIPNYSLKISKEGLASLQDSLPNCHINRPIHIGHPRDYPV